jgi:hypothetical protein
MLRNEIEKSQAKKDIQERQQRESSGDANNRTSKNV